MFLCKIIEYLKINKLKKNVIASDELALSCRAGRCSSESERRAQAHRCSQLHDSVADVSHAPWALACITPPAPAVPNPGWGATPLRSPSLDDG